jgi:hypothetical protein
MFVIGSGRNEQALLRTFNRCCLPGFDSFGKAVSDEKRRLFRNQPIRNKNSLRQPCFLTDRNEMSILYWGPSKDASYQISIHFAKWLQKRRFFRNQPIRNKNCLWWPCLLTERDEMSNLYRGHAIDASYQVSVHLTKQFQRKRLFRIDQPEKRIACGRHVCNRIGKKWASFIKDFQ